MPLSSVFPGPRPACRSHFASGGTCRILWVKGVAGNTRHERLAHNTPSFFPGGAADRTNLLGGRCLPLFLRAHPGARPTGYPIVCEGWLRGMNPAVQAGVRSAPPKPAGGGHKTARAAAESPQPVLFRGKGGFRIKCVCGAGGSGPGRRVRAAPPSPAPGPPPGSSGRRSS